MKSRQDIEEDIAELQYQLEDAKQTDRYFTIQRLENKIRKLELILEEMNYDDLDQQ